MGMLAWLTGWTTSTPPPERREPGAAPPPLSDDAAWFRSRIHFWREIQAQGTPSAAGLERLEAERDLRTRRGEFDRIAREMVLTGGWYMPPSGASGVTAEAVSQFITELRATNVAFEEQRADYDWQARAREGQPEHLWGWPGI